MCNHKSSPILQFLYIYERVKNQDDPSVNFSYTAQQKNPGIRLVTSIWGYK